MSESCIKHIETYWKEKTASSNLLFNERKFEEALLGYEEALYRAEALNNNRTACIIHGIPFIQTFIISCNNIAFTCIELGIPDKAEKMFKRSIYFLLHLSTDISTDVKEIQSELKRAVLTYQNFADRHDIKPQNRKLPLEDIIKQTQ